MKRSRWKTNKGILALLLSALMVTEPVGAAITVHAEEGVQTPQVTDLDQTQEPGTDGTLTGDTEIIGQESTDGSVNDSEQNKDGQESGEDRDIEEGSDGSSTEDTDKKDETTENPGEEEDDNEQVKEPGEEDPDVGEDPENPDVEEELDEENPDGDETDEKQEDEELAEDPEKAKEDVENKALNGFVGMPDGYKLSASQIERKRSIAAHIDDVEDFREGADYAEGELVTSAESIEEAEMIAQAYNAEIIEFSWGILTLKLNKDFSVERAVRVAANVDLNMPAVWPNYICYTAGEEPAETADDSVEGIEIEMSEYEVNDSEAVAEEDSELSYASALEFNDPYLELDSSQYQYHHEVIGSAYAWAQKWTGDGIKVAVLDTGMNSHNDLPNVTALKLDNMSEFSPGLPDVNDIADSSDSGHGTHVAGIIAAKANNSMGAGVAPDAQLFIGKALPNNGGGNIAYAMRGIRAAKAAGVDIINMSLGGPGYSELFQDIVDEAYNSGIAIFAAAGNDSRQDNDYPACYNHVISVAATDKNNERASFSNYNKMVDLSAPGVAIWSTSSKKATEYVSMDGTSMACPVAAGEAAVILSANDDIYNMDRNGKRVDALEKLMKANTIKAGSGMGSGITSLPKALKLSTASTKPGAPDIDIRPDNEATAQKVDVEIKAPQNGMTIYYTINGKNPAFKNGLPDAKSETKKYTKEFSINKTAKATIKAIAVNESGVSSAVKSASYTLKPYVTGIEISGIQEIMLGKSIQLKATVTPAYATNKKVDWKLLNEQGQEITGNVGVTINANGKVTATKTATVGKYTVQVTAKDQGQAKSDLYLIEVIDSFKVNKISFKTKNVTLTRPTDKPYDLWEQAVVEPVKENDVLTAANFKWSSSNESVATVSPQGKVTPLKAGTVTITALANDSSNKKATFKVTVKQLAEGITVTGPDVLAAGKSSAFKAQVLPADTSNKKVSWELWLGASKVESGAVTINAGNGKVTVASGAPAGNYTVKAIASDGSAAEGTANFEVASGIITKFTFAKKTDSKVTLCRKTAKLVTGQTVTAVDVTVEGTGTPNWDAYKVTSSNEGIAKATAVRKDKTITLTIEATGNAAGKTNIVLASTDGSNKKLTCAVTVVNPISSIGVAPAAGCNPYVVQGKSLQLKAVVNAEHGAISNKNVDWKLLKEDGTEVGAKDNLGIKIAANGKISMDKNAPYYKEVVENGETVKLRRWYTVQAIAKDGSGVYGTCKIYVGRPTTEVYVCDWDSLDWEFGEPFNWADLNNIILISPSLRLPGKVGYSYWFGIVSNTDLGGYTVSSSNSSVLQVEYIPETDANGYAMPDLGYIRYTVLKKGSATITLKAMDNSGKQVKYKVNIK